MSSPRVIRLNCAASFPLAKVLAVWLDEDGTLRGWYDGGNPTPEEAIALGEGWNVVAYDHRCYPGLAEAEETLRREGGEHG